MLVWNNLKYTFMLSSIHNNGSVQQWKKGIRGKIA